MKFSGAEIAIKLLEIQGVEYIAGIPGGTNLPLYDALFGSSIKHILTRHEQGAGFLVQGMARSTGKAAVCFATSGPGATNVITAIADAKLDSIPMVIITGQVPVALIGTDAFQEVDTYGITLPIVKHNFFVRSPKDLLTMIPEAFRIAEEGRPGPVVVDIPKDVQNQKININNWPQKYSHKARSFSMKPYQLEKITQMIHEAKKPILYVGGGIINSGAREVLYAFAKKNSIPVVSTLMGLGGFPIEDPLYLGMLGMHGARYTNILLNEADLLLAFGVRFDDRATGNVAKFCHKASIIHVDIDPSEINKIKKANISLVGDAGDVLKELLPHIREDDRKEWLEEVEKAKSNYPLPKPANQKLTNAVSLIRYVSQIASPNALVATDVGQHQMWVAQIYPICEPRQLMTSGGLGTMGFGLPAAIGAAVANPERKVICFSGDGSILMNIQELATLADLNLDVKVIVMNNGHLGLVRQQQELFYSKHYIASKFATRTDFAAIATGFGIKSYDLGREENKEEILRQAILEKGPCLINASIEFSENVMPMVPPGAGNVEAIG